MKAAGARAQMASKQKQKKKSSDADKKYNSKDVKVGRGLENIENAIKKGARDPFWASLQTSLALNKHKMKEIDVVIRKPLSKKDVSSTYLIDPEHPLKLVWDQIIGLLILYSIIFVPFRICFQLPHYDGLEDFDHTIDAIFLADILLNLNTFYVDQTRNDEIITDRLLIAKRYLKSWFIIDFLSALPFELMIASSLGVSVASEGGLSNQVKAIRLLRITRLTRLTSSGPKVAKVIGLGSAMKSFDNLNINPATINIIKVLMQVVFIAHLVACFWFYLTTDEVVTDPSELTWTNVGFPDDFKYNCTVFDQYVASYYWATTTMLSIGYGDVHAYNNSERIYSMFVFLIGGLLFGTVVTKITKLLQSRNPSKRSLKIKLDELKAYLGDSSVPVPMKIRITGAYKYYLENKSTLGDAGIFDGLPKHMLIKLVQNVYDDQITPIKLFRTIDQYFVSCLMVSCHPFQVTHGDAVSMYGDVAEDIYFIVQGDVRLTTQYGDRIINCGYTTTGGFFGDFEYMTKSTRIASYEASINCNLFGVPFAVLDRVIFDNPDAGKELLDEIGRRYSLFKLALKTRVIKIEDMDGDSRTRNDSGYAHEEIWFEGLDKLMAIKSLAKIMEVNFLGELDRDHLFRVLVWDVKSNSESITEGTFKMMRDRFLIHPNGKEKLCWDGIIGFLIIYSIIVVPVQIAFKRQALGAYVIVEYIINALFIVDMFMNFQTPYFDDAKDAFVIMYSKIWTRYLYSWFLIDFFSSVPFDIIISATGEGGEMKTANLAKTLRMGRLIKLPRIAARMLKSSKYFSKLEAALGVPPAVFDSITLSIQLLLCVHVTACIWWGVSDAIGTETWFDDPLGFLGGAIRDSPLETQYVVSLYYSFTTLSTTGYGDVYPTSTNERILSIFIELLGATFFGYTLASVATIMVDTLDSKQVRVNERLAEISEYLSERGCPDGLSGMIVRHFRVMYMETSIFDEETIMSRLPKQLRAELFFYIYGEKLQKIAILRYIPNRTVGLYLFKMMSLAYYDPGQYLIRQGEGASRLMFIQFGKARYFHDKKMQTKVQVQKKGKLSPLDLVEEMSAEEIGKFMKSSPEEFNRDKNVEFYGDVTSGDFVGYAPLVNGGAYKASVRALTAVSVYVMRKSDISQLSQEQPSIALQLQSALVQAIHNLGHKIEKQHIRVTRGLFLKESKAAFKAKQVARALELKGLVTKNEGHKIGRKFKDYNIPMPKSAALLMKSLSSSFSLRSSNADDDDDEFLGEHYDAATMAFSAAQAAVSIELSSNLNSDADNKMISDSAKVKPNQGQVSQMSKFAKSLESIGQNMNTMINTNAAKVNAEIDNKIRTNLNVPKMGGQNDKGIKLAQMDARSAESERPHTSNSKWKIVRRMIFDAKVNSLVRLMKDFCEAEIRMEEEQRLRQADASSGILITYNANNFIAKKHNYFAEIVNKKASANTFIINDEALFYDDDSDVSIDDEDVNSKKKKRHMKKKSVSLSEKTFSTMKEISQRIVPKVILVKPITTKTARQIQNEQYDLMKKLKRKAAISRMASCPDLASSADHVVQSEKLITETTRGRRLSFPSYDNKQWRLDKKERALI